MRESLGRRFDVVIVIWALALAVGWSFVTLGRTEVGDTRWGEPAHGPAWVVYDSAPPIVP